MWKEPKEPVFIDHLPAARSSRMNHDMYKEAILNKFSPMFQKRRGWHNKSKHRWTDLRGEKKKKKMQRKYPKKTFLLQRDGMFWKGRASILTSTRWTSPYQRGPKTCKHRANERVGDCSPKQPKEDEYSQVFLWKQKKIMADLLLPAPIIIHSLPCLTGEVCEPATLKKKMFLWLRWAVVFTVLGWHNRFSYMNTKHNSCCKTKKKKK